MRRVWQETVTATHPWPAGPSFDAMSQGELATLAREYLLCGHLVDRAAMPYVIARWGRDGMRDIAIDEWMGASPVYTRRMQKVLGFDGGDVTTIFKGMQFDIGAPHEFLDFRYTVADRNHGEFRLDHCGALMDVEPMGGDFVVAMCHDIEDPTFDATVAATNPRARARPVHRPPREPEDRVPHCAWTVTIDPDAAPVGEAAITAAVRSSTAASTPLAGVPATSEGPTRVHERDTSAPAVLLDDYSGPLVDPIDTACFSAGALVPVCEELRLQQHLLATAFMLAVQRRHGTDAAREMGAHQMVGAAGVGAERLGRVFAALPGSGRDPLERIAEVAALHPLLGPRTYLDAAVYLTSDSVEVVIGECIATSDPDELSWANLLVGGGIARPGPDGVDAGTRALAAVARAVDPRARVERVDGPGGFQTNPDGSGVRARWEIGIGSGDVAPCEEVELARMSTGSGFVFERATPVVLTGRGDA